MPFVWLRVWQTFVVDGKKYFILKERKQPKRVFTKDLPKWPLWSISFTLFNLKTNEIRRIRSYKINKIWSIEVVTKEFWKKSKEKPFIFRLVKKLS